MSEWLGNPQYMLVVQSKVRVLLGVELLPNGARRPNGKNGEPLAPEIDVVVGEKKKKATEKRVKDFKSYRLLDFFAPFDADGASWYDLTSSSDSARYSSHSSDVKKSSMTKTGGSTCTQRSPG